MAFRIKQRHHRTEGERLLIRAAHQIPDAVAFFQVLEALPEAAREDAYARIVPHLRFKLTADYLYAWNGGLATIPSRPDVAD